MEWTGVHHSRDGDFTDISTHVVTYDTESRCHVTAGGRLVGEADYTYCRFDDRMGVVIYRPAIYQGRNDVVLHAMFDFAEMTDRAVLTAGGEPFAVADGRMRLV
ncbi:hypothetical protein H2509_19715 [Stappia sp. F7233]|uniref:Uncharacterized protein n=1 Tax=Stappia albiluteola TaxID=2758565 RepID=A0A839AI21_9HYPH|nr:hypothetical protein [Stappia albiluteola]